MSRAASGARDPFAALLLAAMLMIAALPASAAPSPLPADPTPGASTPPAMAYRVGERWTGRLAAAGDSARLAFTLHAPQHLRLRLRQPGGADLEVRLSSAGGELLRQRATSPGEPLDVELWLEGGDFELTLVTIAPPVSKAARPVLRLARLDPFRVPPDAEPNHTPELARAAPAALAWEGGPAGSLPDVDAWWLPPLAAPGAIRVAVDGERPALRLFADAGRTRPVELSEDADGALLAGGAPVGVPLYLELDAEGPYRVELSAPGWSPVRPALAPPVELALQLPADAALACLAAGGTLEASLEAVNAGALPLDLELRTMTSHAGVSAVPGQRSVQLAQGEEVEVPMTVTIAAGSCPDEPVTLSVAAVAPDGGLASVSTTVAP